MTDVLSLATLVKTTLHDVAKQAAMLGAGLQNVAPVDKAGGPNNSIQYLLKMADDLNALSDKCEDIINHVKRT